MAKKDDTERSEHTKETPLATPSCSPNRFAIYDNPSTGDREWYRNGEMTAKVNRRIIEMGQKSRGPNQLLSDDALELWEPGNIKGDETAISKENDQI